MKVTSSQVHWFRLQRSGLVEPFTSAEETAHRLIGVQAQLPPAAALAIWNRTSALTHADLEALRLDRRTLVRFWGQRNTAHLYAARDWPFLHSAIEQPRSAPELELEQANLRADFNRLIDRTRRRLAAGEHLTYKDVGSKKLEEGFELRWHVAYAVLLQLVREGVVCHGPDRAGESGFVHREHWLPDLDWSPPAAEDALPELAVRYLSTYGPAEPGDLAYWYDTKVSDAKRWIEAAGARCSVVEVDGRNLSCATDDLDSLAGKPPPLSDWPVRLLYRFDPLLLAIKDKSWLIDPEQKKKVWRPAAHVAAVLLVGGRIAGTWRYDRRSKSLSIRVSPFDSLSRTEAGAVMEQAKGIAAFFGLELKALEGAHF